MKRALASAGVSLPDIAMQSLSRAMTIPWTLAVILLLPLHQVVDAYTWQFTSPPRQCSNVTISIHDSGGQPPYSLLIVPTGPSPLPNNTEVRSIQNIPFPGTSTTLSFNLNYPENSSFVAVVSDKGGFGTGGASTPVTVLPSSDSSCYSPAKPIHLPWLFFIEPTGGLTQCESLRLWWNASSVNGTVNFYGTIPGGTSFAVPQGLLSSTNDTGTGFNWTVDIAGGTDFLLIGNDDEGIGTGGIAAFTIGYTMNNSCLNDNSPSSTAGNPAGGSYPTGLESSGNGSGSYPASSGESWNNGRGSHPSSNSGAIVGGVVGVVMFLVSTGLLASWFIVRRSYYASSRRRAVNVLQDDEDVTEDYHGLPQHFVPEPFIMPDPTTRGTSEDILTPFSVFTFTEDIQRPPIAMSPTSMTTTTRKAASFRRLRTVSIIQHNDAGPGHDGPETIELPPAYSNIRQPQRSQSFPLASSTPTDAMYET